MENIVWLIPENKRKAFNTMYQRLIMDLPKEIWKDKDYMPYWDSELSFPAFNKSFIMNLSNDCRHKIRELYEEIIVKD